MRTFLTFGATPTTPASLLPLAIISGPLTLVTYPSEDRDEYFYSSAFLPSLGLGTFLGTVLSAPFYPFGIPCMADEPVVERGPGE